VATESIIFPQLLYWRKSIMYRLRHSRSAVEEESQEQSKEKLIFGLLFGRGVLERNVFEHSERNKFPECEKVKNLVLGVGLTGGQACGVVYVSLLAV
jgi:hypothetical protein